MSQEITNIIKEFALSDAMITLVATIIGWGAIKITKIFESRKNYDVLKSGIKSIVLFIQKDLQNQDGLIRSTEAWGRINLRYDKVIKSLGLSEQEVKEIIERVYEDLRNQTPRLFESYPKGQPYDPIDVPSSTPIESIPVQTEVMPSEGSRDGIDLMK